MMKEMTKAHAISALDRICHQNWLANTDDITRETLTAS
jgi:hypothetical protein